MATQQMIQFRLLRGMHTEGKGDARKTYQVSRNPVTKEPIQPVFESNKPLDEWFNDASGNPKFRKFERVNPVPQPIVINPLERQAGETVQTFLARLNELTATIKAETQSRLKALDGMSFDKLKEFAEDEELDITTAKTREQALTLIKSALKGE